METDVKIPLTDEDRDMIKREAQADGRSMRKQAQALIREALAARKAKSRG